MKTRWMMILMCGLGAACSLEGVELNTRDYRDSDVNVVPMLPVQGEEAKVTVRLRNSATDAVAAGKVSVRDHTGNVIAETPCESVPAAGELTVELPYRPQRNGYQALTVVFVPDGGKAVQAEFVAPVISRPLYFPWFGGHEPENRSLKFANIVMSFQPETSAYWRRRGALVTLWKGVLADKDTPEAYAAYLAEGIDAIQADGIMVDEMGNYDENAIASMPQFQGLKRFSQEYPKYFSMLWIAGSMRVNYCNIAKNLYRAKGVDLILAECYANFILPEFSAVDRYAYFDQRIDMARQQDVLSNTIMTLGVSDNADKFNLTKYEIEDEVRYVKRRAPEMPGIGFFHANGPEKALIAFSDDLARKYYVEGVAQLYNHDLQLDPVTPAPGQEVTVYAQVYNLGAMDIGTVEVRFFVDGTLAGARQVTLPATGKGETLRPVTVGVPVTFPAGYHTLRAELWPSDATTTVLDGVAVREVAVR